MLDEGALAVSLPALELKGVRLPGSLFAASDLGAAKLSPALAIAVELVTKQCLDRGYQPVFVARPEIFTHGASLAWLSERLGGAGDHLALSDGTTVRLIPSLRNHVFFYGLGRIHDEAALQRLERRAPELFGVLASQVNTARRFGAQAKTPKPVVIAGLEAREAAPPGAYRIAVNIDSVDDSLDRTLRSASPFPPAERFAEVEYVALTEASLGDTGFGERLAAKLNLGYFDSRRALILRLPPNAGDSYDVEDRLRATLAALVGARARVPLAAAPHSWFVTSDLTVDRIAEMADAVDFVTHDSFDFWRYSPAFYQVFRTVRIHARARMELREGFAEIVAGLTGRDAEIVWRSADHDRFSH